MPSETSNGTCDSIVADFVIVGAGFGGCYALHQLRLQGYSAKIIEAGSDFGGVWHFNRYPGARVDSETPTYQLSLTEVSDGFNFSQRFPGHEELRSYFGHLSKTLDLRKDAIFNQRIISADYEAASKTWLLKSATGFTARCQYVVFASGTTNKAYIPDFPGLSNFKGQVIHPASWPENLDLEGKSIGLVGQGASGLQILQELAKKDCNLSVFIRTPCTGVPMGQRNVCKEESEAMKNQYGAIFKHAKHHSRTGYAYNESMLSFHDATPEEREQLWETLWARGGFGFLTSNYWDYSIDKEANAALYQFWARKVRARVTDPAKREIVAPLEQTHWIGTKRPNLEMDYYEMIDRPNVKLVSLAKSPIKEFVRDGVVTETAGNEELHPLDLVIVATGYDSVTGSMFDMNIRSKDGQTLQEKWKDGIATHLGMMVPGMPNAFFLYGPQAPTSLANGPPFLELQVEFITKLLENAKRDKIASIEVSEAAAAAWRAATLQGFEMVLHSQTDSWWNGANVPGKNREPLLWFGGMHTWWDACEETLKDWASFVVS